MTRASSRVGRTCIEGQLKGGRKSKVGGEGRGSVSAGLKQGAKVCGAVSMWCRTHCLEGCFNRLIDLKHLLASHSSYYPIV